VPALTLSKGPMRRRMGEMIVAWVWPATSRLQESGDKSPHSTGGLAVIGLLIPFAFWKDPRILLPIRGNHSLQKKLE